MRRWTLYTVILVGMILPACGSARLVQRTSYLQEFYALKEIRVETDRYVSESGDEYLRLRLAPAEYVTEASIYDNAGRYRALCAEYGDLGYEGGTMNRMYDPIVTGRYPSVRFTALSVSGNVPVPDPLVVTVSPWPFIRSGYKLCDYGKVETSEFFRAVYPYREGYIQPFYPVEKRLSALTPDDLTLPGHGDFAWLPQYFTLFIPATPSLTTLTLTLQDASGREYAISVISSVSSVVSGVSFVVASAFPVISSGGEAVVEKSNNHI